MASTTTANHQQPKQRTSSVEEEVISLDSVPADSSHPKATAESNPGGQTIVLSKKAIHQRDADENLFLRFLELDPPPDGSGSGSQGSGPHRRMSTFKPAVGRTPFTITKRLTRTAEKGFGFSIVWTHPPRVEKIEPGLSAEKNGIIPGDYVIFVDKHNVVTMPEADVLNLIRSQGNSLTIEIFRRSGPSNVSGLGASGTNRVGSSIPTGATYPIVVNTNVNGLSSKKVTSATNNYIAEEMSPAIKQTVGVEPRSSTVCSNTSLETTKRRLHLPQVTFSKESIAPCHTIEDQRRRILVQVITREQNFVNTLQFGMQRFAIPLQERRDLISPNDHRTLFQNIDELIRISEDILEQLVQDDQEIPLNFASRVYLSKTTAICAAYKKYCNGIKRADCVLVNKSRQPGSDFVSFITEPQVPRKRPDLTMFIHRPLQHFREILKLMQLLASHCRVDSEEHKNFTSVINELQAAYREITVGGGLMEPLGEGRPLLTLQDLESRMVFTKCKPFTLAVQGRQWIFGGDLSRVEGRSVKPYWTLLFSDILVFTKVSRDRVMFITEEPLPIANIVDSCFHMRKKTTEFRITVDPNGRTAESPTAYCAPDLSRTPKKSLRRKSLILRAPSLELKAVWQNLLQRQIFLVNAALGSTPLSSPLESPDIFNTLVPLCDIGATTTSMASMKLSSMDSINNRNLQVRLKQKSFPNKLESSYDSIPKLQSILHNSSNTLATTMKTSTATITSTFQQQQAQNTTLQTSQSICSSSRLTFSGSSINSTSYTTVNTVSLYTNNPSVDGPVQILNSGNVGEIQSSSKSLTAIPETISELPELVSNNNPRSNSTTRLQQRFTGANRSLVEFGLSSVGRSFIDETGEEFDENASDPSLKTPETPTPNISPTSSTSHRCPSDTFSNDFVVIQEPSTPSVIVSPMSTNDPFRNFFRSANRGRSELDSRSGIDVDLNTKSDPDREELGGFYSRLSNSQYGGSWDLLELDLDFHEVNFDPSYYTDVEEYVFLADDPFGILPCRPTPPDSLDL